MVIRQARDQLPPRLNPTCIALPRPVRVFVFHCFLFFFEGCCFLLKICYVDV